MRPMSSSPSISNRNGLATTFSVACTPVAAPSRAAMTPQHSLGASRTACATISSSSVRAILTRNRLDVLRVQALGVVVLVVGRDVRERVLELAHALAERPADLGELLRPQHDQGDDEDHDELHGSDVEWHGVERSSLLWVTPW